MRHAPFDRFTGCETLEYTESQERVRAAMAERAASFAWHGVTIEWNGQTVTVELRLDTIDQDRPVAVVYGLAETARRDGEGYMEWKNRVGVLTSRIAPLAIARLHEERRELEHAQTDARAIAWLKGRGLLVERDGAWVLEC